MLGLQQWGPCVPQLHKTLRLHRSYAQEASHSACKVSVHWLA